MSAHRDKVCTDWSEDEMITLSRMASDGHSARAIAEKLGRTRNSVIGRVHRSGIKLLGKTCRPAIKKILKKELIIKVAKVIKAQPKPVNFLPAVREKPKPLGSAPPYLMTRLQDLKPNQCRWIVEKDFNDDYLYCGHPVVKDQSWCAHCRKVVFLPFVPMRKIARRHL